jgi:ABC-type Zn2+ transport system substrate-binding protein/surface adhesin
MTNSFRIIIHLFLSFSIIGQINLEVEAFELVSHLNSYSEINKTYHDNIDDSTEEHVHGHKHSEDGDEHEHEHSKISQNDLKILTNTESIQPHINDYKSSQGFSNKVLFSNPHILQIFRPPIAYFFFILNY